MRINSHILELSPGYIFTEVINRTKAYLEAHLGEPIYRLGVGDVRGPLVPAVVEAMHHAIDEQAHADTFHGYGLEEGPRSLRQAIIEAIYKPLGVPLDPAEVFITDGAGSDLGNLTDLFDSRCTVGVPNPGYPCYLDSSMIAGMSVVSLPCTAQTGFKPIPPQGHVDVVYLCSPGNPIGVAMTREELGAWVTYALEHRTILIFDAAYQDFIQTDGIPRSIYEIPQAREVAIEVCSFSKKAAFTGIRCGYTIVPSALMGYDDAGEEVAVTKLWLRRVCAKFNGVSYITTRGAQAALSVEGMAQTRQQIATYMSNVRLMRQCFDALGLVCYGGVDGPYIWMRCPKGYSSWQFFDFLLEQYHIVCTPGVGFGSLGEGYVRFSAFGHPDDISRALDLISDMSSRFSDFTPR